MTPTEFKQIRERLGMTQAQFAEALGFSGQPRIVEIEKGRRRVTPRTERLILARWPQVRKGTR